MMRTIGLLLGAMAVVLTSAFSAAADDTDVNPFDDGFSVKIEEDYAGRDGGAAAGENSQIGDIGGTWHTRRSCPVACTPEHLCPDGSYKVYLWFRTEDGENLPGTNICLDEAGEIPLTPGRVLEAFRRIPLPASPLIIQPPDGRTLVNFETNFYTEQETLFRSVILLGQRVDLRIDVHSFTWHFDDGETLTTTKPGAPYPKLQITHNYLKHHLRRRLPCRFGDDRR